MHLIERGGIIGARRYVYISVRTCKFAIPKNQTIYQSSASNLRDYVAFGGGGDKMLIWWCFCARARKKKKIPETSRDYLKGGRQADQLVVAQHFNRVPRSAAET